MVSVWSNEQAIQEKSIQNHSRFLTNKVEQMRLWFRSLLGDTDREKIAVTFMNTVSCETNGIQEWRLQTSSETMVMDL